MPNLEHSFYLAAGGVLILTALLAAATVIFCRMVQEHWQRKSDIPPLPAGLGWITIVCALPGAMYFVDQQQWVPFIAITAIIALMFARGISPFVFWRLRVEESGFYVGFALFAYAAMLIPIFLVVVFSHMACSAVGIDMDPQPAVDQFMKIKNPGTLAAFLVMVGIITPIWEEIFFRGFLYPALITATGRPAALLLSSLIFGAIHFHIPTLAPLTLAGLAFALAYEITGRLGCAIALHGVFNLATCAVLFAYKYGQTSA
jgi:membrane protease YdiL (CAAX protease family)